jgi:hypothetical protein
MVAWDTRESAVLCMPRAPAFITTRLPVLYSIHGANGSDTLARMDVAVLVHGVPSFIATYEMPRERLDETVASLQRGDVRVAVSGVTNTNPTVLQSPRAHVSIVCADGRRFTVARLRSRLVAESAEEFARRVAEEVASGTQLPHVDDVERI